MPKPFTIPGAPAELVQLINARRASIPAGLMMMADDQPETQPGDDQSEGLGGFKSQQSKDSVLADLAAERQARKALEAQFARVAEAFGVVPEKGAKPDEAVAKLDAAVVAMQRQLSVGQLARQHGITDEDDIAALVEVGDEAKRAKLAARLAPAKSTTAGDDKPDEQKPQTWPRPKPDATQGPKGEAPKAAPKPGMPRLSEAVTAALESKN